MHKFSMKAVAVATVIGGAMAGALSASAALNLPTQSCSYTFNTNMRLGSTGADVMNLQKVLNMYPQTQVAASGAGSPGNETSYFGPATRAAVNKFHALHLVELGITAPTGNVYAGTRALLNSVCTGAGTGTGLPAGCTSTAGYSPLTGQSCGTPVPTTPGTVTGPVSAMLAASQPAGMLVQGQSGARLVDVVFTGNGTVTSVELQRVGVSTDTALTNVYLYDGNVRLTDAASVVTGGFIRFNSPSGLFTVAGSRTITVRADIAGSTSGQSVGVKLNSVTANGAVSTFSNVMGNALQVGSADLATVTLATTTVTTLVDAGAVNQVVWGATVTPSRDVNLRAATFKFVGSAPADAIANLSLYVDGVKVSGPTTINAANNNKVVFDLGATAYLMRSGAHTVEVRGDIVKGSNRTYQFSIENAADLMLEDSVLGLNITAKVSGVAVSQTNSAASVVTIQKGSVTVNSDSSFTATKVTGGATNVPVGQFTLKAYGEDVKVNSLAVGLATTTGITSLNNVSLYVNGAQVGTSQNYTSGATSTYNLGSSLIIPANTSVTVTVKADMVDSSNTAYTSGTIRAWLGGVALNAQGQSSNELVSVASTAIPSNVLTVSSGAGTFARTAGFAGTSVSPNTTNVKIGSFTIQANSAEDMKVTSIAVGVTPTTYAITNISNLRVVSNGVTLGTPVGNVSAGTTTFSFGEIVVPANGTRTFEVYADIGSAADGSVKADMAVTYRGAVSNTTTTSSATGISITSAVAALATPTLGTSVVSQYVVGGSTFGIANFRLKTSDAGTVATVREMRFAITGSNDAIESVTVAGVTAPVVNGSSTVTGLNIGLTSSGLDVPVTVKFAGFQGSTTGGSLSSGIASTTVVLRYVEATSGSGTVITKDDIVGANGMKLYASKPTVTAPATTGNLSLGTVKLGQFTVTADANGAIQLATTTLVTSTSSAASIGVANVHLRENGNTTALSNTVANINSGTAYALILTSPYQISAGQSKTFEVWGTISASGSLGAAGASQVSTQLSSDLSLFSWNDVVTGTNNLTGTGIINFPSDSSFILKN